MASYPVVGRASNNLDLFLDRVEKIPNREVVRTGKSIPVTRETPSHLDYIITISEQGRTETIRDLFFSLSTVSSRVHLSINPASPRKGRAESSFSSRGREPLSYSNTCFIIKIKDISQSFISIHHVRPD